MAQTLFRDDIIIDCGLKISGQTRGYVPAVPTPEDRYTSYIRKLAMRGLSTKVNSFPWEWRKKKKKTFLDKPAKKIRKRIETVSTK